MKLFSKAIAIGVAAVALMGARVAYTTLDVLSLKVGGVEVISSGRVFKIGSSGTLDHGAFTVLDVSRNLTNIGGLQRAYANQTGNFTASFSTTYYFVDTSGGAVTATLPAAGSSHIGKELIFFKTTSDINNVTVQRAGSDTINGGTSQNITTQYKAIEVVCSGNTAFLTVSLL
jgi:hypothetical protein